MHSWIFRHRRGLGALYGMGQVTADGGEPGDAAPALTSEPDVISEREVLRPFRRPTPLPPPGRAGTDG